MKLIDRKKKIRLIIMCIAAIITVVVVKYFEKGKLDKLDLISFFIVSAIVALILYFTFKRANK